MTGFRSARRSLLVALCVAATFAAAPAQADAWKLGMKAGGHYPRAGKAWPIEVTATKRGAPLRAKLLYQFIFAGQVVGTASPAGRTDKPFTFHGRVREKLKFPKRAIGYQLTLRVLVRVKGRGKKHIDYALKVRR